MDNHTPTLLPPDVQTDFPGYTPYPDAGDPLMLTAELPVSSPFSTEPHPAPAFPAIPTPSPGKATIPRHPPASRSKHAAVPSPASHREKKNKNVSSHPLKRLLSGVFSLLALLVYGGFLLAEGGTLLEEGLGKLAVEGFFGFTDRAETVPVMPPETTTTPPSVPDTEPVLPPRPETVPPAREEPIPSRTAAADRDLSSRSPNGLGLINETPYTPDLPALAAAAPVIDSYSSLESIYGSGVPAVLILHTHGTEAFADHAEDGYHTADRQDNICAVGEALAALLQASGIGVIHCTELFDEESFDLAYYNAAGYIRETLQTYPSIRYILDIHRDAITTEDGLGIRPLSTSGSEMYAQLMFVVGTDHGGSGHDTWENNLALAARLQADLHEVNPTLMRDINLRSASFNAQYAPGALLVEAGAACSTLEEAIRSIEVFGEALVREIRGE